MAAAKITADSTVPAGAKKPQDRKPKENPDGTLTLTIRDGEFKIAENAMRDFRLIRLLAAMEDGDGLAAPRLLDFLLGKEQAEKALSGLADETGFVEVEAVVLFIGDLFQAISPNS